MMEVVVTTGAVSLESNRHQQTNIPQHLAFYRPDALPVTFLSNRVKALKGK